MQMEALQMTPVRPVHMSAESHLGETLPKKEVKGFSDYLTDALKETNQLQIDSDKWNAALAAGKVDDVSQVVIASQKADIALQLTLQIRNRAVSAYQEIMRMQV
ncbi:MAG: flagellar hook-basal body complex protein FliE [Veillonellaceae bacterium]|uniref:flagellar hook-basal body complex protein FliE n=1 Tax=uncultured Selenomonas sp. TaxID=159275 RepID=UPI0025EB22F0|nr:flagellar hook-basal body complex protein FliE [uncultured Selenomonas sp.]MCI7541343.1 flagellar hook-basal body complex protein FliE [Veillonellaceae bacterium]MDD6127002.1 flagellar hook-basal body complex protein FliE [Veillonellaceae bacterium]MDD6698130.1 flagellar hook-basal body complex protein FliE [Veillonellaceae bacterium]MDY6351191.1 flagellar hook-basal body complex protein FliE [Selenomonas sp.]